MNEESQSEPLYPGVTDPILKKISDASEDWVPPVPDKVIEGDFRKRVIVDRRLISDVAKELAHILAERKTIFRFHRRICIFEDGGLRPITPAEFPSWLESAAGGNVVCQKFVGPRQGQKEASKQALEKAQSGEYEAGILTKPFASRDDFTKSWFADYTITKAIAEMLLASHDLRSGFPKIRRINRARSP